MVKHGVKGENPGDSFFSWSHLIQIDKNLMEVDRNPTQRDRKGEKNKLTVSLAIRLICLRCREYIQTEISLTENMSPDKKRPTERWYRWQIPSEQTSRDRGVAWPPLSPQDPPLPTVVTSQQCRFCCSSPTTAAVSEGSRFPTSGTLCCSDEGSDAIRRPASPHQPSLLRLMRECLNEEGGGSGVSDGTGATVVVVVPIRRSLGVSEAAAHVARTGTGALRQGSDIGKGNWQPGLWAREPFLHLKAHPDLEHFATFSTFAFYAVWNPAWQQQIHRPAPNNTQRSSATPQQDMLTLCCAPQITMMCPSPVNSNIANILICVFTEMSQVPRPDRIGLYHKSATLLDHYKSIKSRASSGEADKMQLTQLNSALLTNMSENTCVL